MEKQESGKEIGHDLYYEHTIAIKCAIFCFDEKKLKVLLVKNNSGLKHYKLPSASLPKGGKMSDTAERIVKDYIFFENFFLGQLQAFGSNVSSLQEYISIGYYAMLNKESQTDESSCLHSDVLWADVKDIGCLNEQDAAILEFSKKTIKKNICCSALGFKLLPDKFTLLQVVHLYEEILGIEINKVNFRRKILQRQLVQALNEKQEGVSYRAASFYTLNVSEDEMFWSTKFNFNF